ncbi:hypothetical protein [Methylobacterium thuringiense]|uniref:hypothetical protein n=1 Tax=Methylobacterium thuringiense TaxID=1003091 RepID=UPI001EE077C4|nr:hypothetical protein [Methylobacterium thuringiense]
MRYLALHNFVEKYPGRMKTFLDESCEKLNNNWDKSQYVVKEQVRNFKEATKALIDIFGANRIARKENSKSFNRAIFDALVFYASEPRISDAMLGDRDRVINAYNEVLKNPEFAEAIESDTAGLPHTEARLRIWGEALHNIIALPAAPPKLVDGRISFAGF